MMRQCKKLTVYPARESDIWTYELRNDYNYAMEILNYYLQDGYVIYDAPASGDIDLSALAVGKYIVIWKTNTPSGTMNISHAKTCQGSGAVDHTDVVIMGIKVNTYNMLSSFQSININVTSGDDLSNLSFICGQFNSNATYGTLIKYATFSDLTLTTPTFATFLDCNFDYVKYIKKDFLYEDTIQVSTGQRKIYSNCEFTEDVSGAVLYFYDAGGSSSSITLKNCKISGFTGTSPFEICKFKGKTINFENVYINKTTSWGFDYSAIPKPETGYNIIYTIKAPINGSSYGYILKAPKTGQIFIDGYDTLDITKIQTAGNYQTMDCEIQIEYITETGDMGTISKRFFRVNFLEDFKLDDDLKYFSPKDLLVIKRSDIESVLVGVSAKKIKNYQLYLNDGTTEYDYRNDDNFLIIASYSGSKYVFIWYNGSVYGTVFSDIWPDVTYTIENVIQIWRPSENISGLSSTVDVADTGIKGSIDYDNVDNEVVLV